MMQHLRTWWHRRKIRRMQRAIYLTWLGKGNGTITDEHCEILAGNSLVAAQAYHNYNQQIRK